MSLKTAPYSFVLVIALLMSSCRAEPQPLHSPKTPFYQQSSELPAPAQSNSKLSKTIGWPNGKTPKAPVGFMVSRYATLQNPRWIYVLPNGDVLVSQARKSWGGNVQSPNRITLLRGVTANGSAAQHYNLITSGLNLPFGMLFLKNWLYIADTDHLIRLPYHLGQTKVDVQADEVMAFPEKGYHGHWTRNVIARSDGQKLYIAIGSASNVGEGGMEQEVRRANILEINPDGSDERIFASGLRNPIGIAFYPNTQTLWAVVNERDELGDELVPDYLTHVMDGGFYGWPYSYFGQHEDPRRKGERPDLVSQAIVPDFALDSHVAALGLAFYTGRQFPAKYQNGAFIGEHGSWNRSQFVGYKVVFIPFKTGKPNGKTEDFLTGFIANDARAEVYGRPVGVAVMKDGSLLVADDEGNAIWRVQHISNKNVKQKNYETEPSAK